MEKKIWRCKGKQMGEKNRYINAEINREQNGGIGIWHEL